MRNGHWGPVVSGSDSGSPMRTRVRLRNRDRTQGKRKRERERRFAVRSEPQVGNNRGEESKRDERKGRGRAARNIHLEYPPPAEDGMRFDQECASGEDNAPPCVKGNPLQFLRSDFSIYC